MLSLIQRSMNVVSQLLTDYIACFSKFPHGTNILSKMIYKFTSQEFTYEFHAIFRNNATYYKKKV